MSMDGARAQRTGLIAGSGDIPAQVANACEASGRDLFVVALAGFAEPAMRRWPHAEYRFDQLGTVIQRLKDEGCTQVCLVGGVVRPDFETFQPDALTAPLMGPILEAARRGDDAILSQVVVTFEQAGLSVVAAESLSANLTAQEGPVGRLNLPARDVSDADRAMEIASLSGLHDIGQGAVVCDGLVLAVEAQEGTDAMLLRVAGLPDAFKGSPQARRGVLAKVPKPQQERRIDLPTIGVRTVEGVARAGLAGLVVEAGGALIVDQEAVARAADAAGVYVVARPAPKS